MDDKAGGGIKTRRVSLLRVYRPNRERSAVEFSTLFIIFVILLRFIAKFNPQILIIF
jgi:hypothetical protein